MKKTNFIKLGISIILVLTFIDLVIFHEVIWNSFVEVAKNQKEINLATLIVTALAFIAAGCAFVVQRNSLNQQIKDSKKQEIIGAWQILSNKTSGNSGKKEAIEFLIQQEKSLEGIDMSAEKHYGPVYLADLNVSEEKLRQKADLRRACFQDANLRVAKFEGANLGWSNFAGADLFSANFRGVNLHESHFEGANLRKAHFEGANLRKSHFESSESLETHFQGANLGWSNFAGADLVGADFKGANLRHSSFQGANLQDTNFWGSDLSMTNFQRSNFFAKELFGQNYVIYDDKEWLPIAPVGYKFEFEFRENNSNPEVKKFKKYFIKLISL